MSTTSLSRCASLETCSLWRILDVTRQLGAPIELDEILALIIGAALEVLRAERGTVFLYDAKTDELFSKVATGSGEIRFPATAGIAGETAQTRDLVNVVDCYSDPRFNREIDRKTGYKTRCLLSTPLVGIDNELVGVLQVLNKKDGVFEEDDEYLARTLAAQCAVSLQRAQLIEEQLVKQKLENDLKLARDIQQALLPRIVPETEGYEVAGWSRPADETGGDIFDIMGLDEERIAVLLADATGHGIGPALSVGQMRAMFRMGLKVSVDLEAIINQINDQLKADLPSNRFITGFIGILDSSRHVLSYHSGGQAPLMHYRAAKREVDWLDSTTLPLGIMAGVRAGDPVELKLEEGDIFGLISDGFFEYAKPDGEQYGKERLAAFVDEHRDLSTTELTAKLVEAVEKFSEGAPQDDDMTVVLIRRDSTA